MGVNYMQFGNNIGGAQQTSYVAPSPKINTDMKWVQGIGAVKAHLLAPNTVMHFWDSEDNKIYIKSTDPNGIPRPITVVSYTVDEVPSEVNDAGNTSSDAFVSKEDLSSVEMSVRKDVASLRDEVSSLTALLSDISEKLDRKQPYNKHQKNGGASDVK